MPIFTYEVFGIGRNFDKDKELTAESFHPILCNLLDTEKLCETIKEISSDHHEITIPIAFEMAAQNVDDIGSATRRRVRDELRTGHILDRMVHDIKYLLSDA